MNNKETEAEAVARVAAAARAVRLASLALERHFKDRDGASGPTLQLVRLTAAMQELEEARDALDVLLEVESRISARIARKA